MSTIMDPELIEFFRKVGELTGDATVGRGMITCGVAALTTVGIVWRWFRSPPNRIRYYLDAPAGTVAHIEIGERKAIT